GQAADIGELEHLAEGTVLVARDLSPVDAALLSRHRVTGFVTEVGGKASHTAIIARSLAVPAVVGARGILDAAGSGDAIVVDGSRGEAVLRPSRKSMDTARTRVNEYKLAELELLEARSLPAVTLDGTELTVSGNIELPSEIDSVLERGGSGIGLYRTEFMFLGRTSPPDEEEHYRSYCNVFEAMGERPLTIRTLDVGGEKLFGAALQHESEVNPALGLRAIRYCLYHPEVFEPQLAGLLRAAVRGNPRLMIPMVSGIEEILAVRDTL
ncbi:MAG: putative PEP-binding protein, partial [Myxococcota bacterium]